MSIEEHKEIVRRFNQEVIAEGSLAAFQELMSDRFVNRSATPGSPDGPESMWNTFNNILRPAFADLRVEIHQQVAEGDWVSTRKTIHGRHTGMLLGIPPTGRTVAIAVVDMVRVCNGRYAEHWGVNNFESLLSSLKNPQP